MIKLFPYQREGAEWLAERKHALLADPMGLGKSAQAIAGADFAGAKKILVVCPASMREIWRHEFKKFSDISRSVHVLFGQTLNTKATAAGLHDTVIIASYDGATGKHFNTLMQLEYDLLICDEAHFLKNPAAKRTKAVYGSKGNGGLASRSKRVWLLTGTPSPNNPSELYPHCRVLFSEGFKNKNGQVFDKFGFIRKFCVTVNNGFGEKIVGGKNLPELKQRLSPFVLRRKKEDVLKDLPPARFDSLYLDAGKLQIPETEALIVRKALESDDPMRALEMVAQQVVTLRRYLGLAKAAPLAAWLKDQIEGGLEKVVIFAHHRDVLDALHEALRGVSQIARIDGSTNATKRMEQVEAFQRSAEVKIFLGNLQAAGTGITLTAASDLIFAEHSWVPAENEQAAMRIHRIGQKNNVLIRYAVVAGSLDERIAEVVRRKSAVIQQIFN